MDRRSLLGTCTAGTMGALAGCLGTILTSETATSELDTDDVDEERSASGYHGWFDIDHDEATAASATEIGDGPGIHHVYLFVASDNPVPVEIDVVVDSDSLLGGSSETIRSESVDLEIGRYVYYHFTVEAAYWLDVSLEGHDLELEIEKDHIEASGGSYMRGSNQAFCVWPDGEVEEVGGIDD
ncbi:hypothetical protein [Natronobacterium texcoconense]|uniref:Uncharacterized protein n=1 Tax=Natronobacterium texcoconense TaxID=1095778 RepID=A0A1H1HZY1_NATTX|nr:hypothetical protein [Natronobacterium texcoconense]SDR31015.1 hypothetical protein SAMN04489842_3194 [Natronobacterium texcoconense]